MNLRTLKTEDPDFRLWLALAWRWMQDRPWAYPLSGGHLALNLYLEQAERVDQKNVGVFENGTMASLITVEMEGAGNFLMHVTSPRRADIEIISAAVFYVVQGLFVRLRAQRIYTLSPIFQGRRAHRGSQLLCRICGGQPTGYEQQDEYGNKWIEFQLTRSEWLQQQGKAA